MKKDDLITDAAYDRLLVLSRCVEEQKQKRREYYWYLISEQAKIVVPDVGLFGIEVNGTYTAGELLVDFYEGVDGSFRRCWRFSHIVGTPEDLVAAIVYNFELLVKDRKQKEKNMRKRKYRKGNPVTSVNELLDQEFVYWHDKIYAKGWFLSWPLRMAWKAVEQGEIYKAERKGEANA